MYTTTAVLLSVVIFTVFVDSFPSPQDSFEDFDKKADELLKDFDKQFNQQQHSFHNLFHKFSQTSLGSDIDTDFDTDLSSRSNFGPDIQNKTTSKTTIKDGMKVTVKETTFTDNNGKQVGVSREVIRTSLDTKPDTNHHKSKTSETEASEEKVKDGMEVTEKETTFTDNNGKHRRVIRDVIRTSLDTKPDTDDDKSKTSDTDASKVKDLNGRA